MIALNNKAPAVMAVFLIFASQCGMINAENDDKSKESSLGDGPFLSADLLAQFEAEDIRNKKDPCIRITILRSHGAPIMFEWIHKGNDKEEESVLVVRALAHERWAADPTLNKPLFKYEAVSKKISINKDQFDFLMSLYKRAPIEDFNINVWASPGIDGSKWIFESNWGGTASSIIRHNPLDVLTSKVEDDAFPRTVAEMQLTGFALALWGLSGLGGEAY